MKNVFYAQAQNLMKENNYERLVLDYISESDVEEIIENLKEDNVKEIIITDNSTGLMHTLGMFLNNGFKVECSVKQKMNKWGTTKEGLLLTK